MKKLLKRIALIAVTVALVCTACLSFAACGPKVSEEISVYVFAGDDDKDTNRTLIENWAANYAKKLIASGEQAEGFTVKTNISFDSNTDTYFTTVRKKIAAGNPPDIFYVSPKYVRGYAAKGTVLNLAEYVDFANFNIADIWGAALGFYAYNAEHKEIGLPVTYANGKFVNENGHEAGIYALPKDYSSFGLGYNARYFTEEYKAKYASTLATTTRAADKGVITVNGEDAGIINVGVPTTYKPYNFYVYKSFAEALEKGDPVAAASDHFGGYTVTIPGYPGETFEIPADKQTQGTRYDASIGYTVFTYAEYSALTWAVTYYLNTVEGGFTSSDGSTHNVYGNDQYEGALYLLPWLAGNNTNYINPDYTNALKSDNEDGTQTGVNSDRFIETYAAFLAYGSDWNGNSYFCGDGNNLGGWDAFNAGYCVFYGCGTWDMPSLNCADKSNLDYQLMPEPVAESYALYSNIKNAKYEMQEYGTKAASFTTEEIQAKLLERQDQWAGRLDSVGYGVSGTVLKAEGTDLEWKIKACADLCASLTVVEETQLELTYAGSQLPNYASQCEDFLKYKDAEGNKVGAFKNMVTPDDADWNEYYAAAKAVAAAQSGKLGEFMAANYPTLKYDAAYQNTNVSKLKTVANAMKALYMISFDYESRNLNLRMCEVNGARDCAMYTYDDSWLAEFARYKATFLLAYCQQSSGSFNKYLQAKETNYVINTADENPLYVTPYDYCNFFAQDVQIALDMSIAKLEAQLK